MELTKSGVVVTPFTHVLVTIVSESLDKLNLLLRENFYGRNLEEFDHWTTLPRYFELLWGPNVSVRSIGPYFKAVSSVLFQILEQADLGKSQR